MIPQYIAKVDCLCNDDRTESFDIFQGNYLINWALCDATSACMEKKHGWFQREWSLFCKCRIYQVNLKHNWLFNTLIILYLSQTNKTDTRPSSDCIWIYITRISRFGVYLAVWPRCEGSFHTLLPLCFPTFLLGASNSSNFPVDKVSKIFPWSFLKLQVRLARKVTITAYHKGTSTCL